MEVQSLVVETTRGTFEVSPLYSQLSVRRLVREVRDRVNTGK